ncbi:Glutaredoxin [Amphibacillus marinus]|uniref:Glutaredoxin n=1 Tax=Amphibacillus marinus TaxID=872970 RepID=A0A1H8JR76_9BACI|nr:glutaredoxin family protein [Amphibacillus marinus]SEN82698.1 Glutaredoxin [Amphibacillus marinus]
MALNEVTVYVSDNCPECEQVIDLIEQFNISYTKKNISENKTYLSELQEHNIYATPAVMMNNEKILGFQKYKIEYLINQLDKK